MGNIVDEGEEMILSWKKKHNADQVKGKKKPFINLISI